MEQEVRTIPKLCDICGVQLPEQGWLLKKGADREWTPVCLKCASELEQPQQKAYLPMKLDISFAGGVLIVGGRALTFEEAELCTAVATAIAEEACNEFQKHDGSMYADEVRRYFNLIPATEKYDY